MAKNFKSFVEAAKWHSSTSDLDIDKPIRYHDGDDDDDYDDDDDDGDYYDRDYDRDYDDDDNDGMNEDDGNNDRYPYDPQQEYTVGNEVVYFGNTGGRRNQEGTISRLRDDGKCVVRFPDRKLVAVSKQHLRLKTDDAEYQRIKAEKAKKKEEDMKNVLKYVPVPGEKWWEKTKNND